jgi:hypothetical protein
MKWIRSILLYFYNDFTVSGTLPPIIRFYYYQIIKNNAAKLRHGFNIVIVSHSMGGYIAWQGTRIFTKFLADMSSVFNDQFVDLFLKTNDVYWISMSTPQINIARPQNISAQEVKYDIVKKFENYLHPLDVFSFPETRLDGTPVASYIQDKNVYTLPHLQIIIMPEMIANIKRMIDLAVDVSPANPKNANNPDIRKRPYGIDSNRLKLNANGRIATVTSDLMVPGWQKNSGYDFAKYGDPFA